mmetsp:Transcript_91758/g.275446  ORF Transcript_91758/g.275446 Transcript_91758/m.275446 type:complete len:205 (-) Transcript_91758:166-780(-)
MHRPGRRAGCLDRVAELADRHLPFASDRLLSFSLLLLALCHFLCPSLSCLPCRCLCTLLHSLLQHQGQLLVAFTNGLEGRLIKLLHLTVRQCEHIGVAMVVTDQRTLTKMRTICQLAEGLLYVVSDNCNLDHAAADKIHAVPKLPLDHNVLAWWHEDLLQCVDDSNCTRRPNVLEDAHCRDQRLLHLHFECRPQRLRQKAIQIL